MKIKSDYVLREIAGDYVIVPVGNSDIDFNGLLTVNEIGKFIWEALSEETTEDEIVDKILDEYEVERERAAKDVHNFIGKLAEIGIV